MFHKVFVSMKTMFFVIFLIITGCEGSKNNSLVKNVEGNDTLTIQDTVNKQNSVPPRITLGGPVENYMKSIGNELLEKRDSQKIDNEKVYEKLLFTGEKQFIGNDSSYLTVIVKYPIVALIKNNPQMNANISNKKRFTYGIFQDSKFFILDYTKPGINFTDDCCKLKYNEGILIEESNNSKIRYTEVKKPD